MDVFLQNLGVSIVAGAACAYITVRLALKRFRAEQWWTRKVDAYSAIFEALHRMKRFDEECEREALEGRQRNEEQMKRLQERAFAGRNDLLEAVDTARFILSDEAVRLLLEAREGLERASKHDSLFEYVEDALGTISGCLEALPEVAKRDLAV